MKKLIIAILAAAMIVPATCFAQDKVTPTRNLIVLLTDGTSTGALSVSRWYKQYTTGTTDNLALDPYLCGLIRMSHADSPIVGSAGSMSTLMTGLLSKSPNICVYPKADPAKDMVSLDPDRKYEPVTNLMDVARQEQGKSLGIVVTTLFYHATPAATAAHAANRNEYAALATQMASMDLTVCFGGGAKMLTPKVRSILEAKGTPLVVKDYDAFRNSKSDKLWAIMADGNMNYDIDRDPGEPSLAEMTSKAIDLLSRNRKGFFLMVEGSQTDFAAHANDPAGIVSEVLAFDDAVKVAIDFAKADRNTTVVVLTDHGNSAVVLGDKNYQNYSEQPISVALGDLPKYKATSFKIAQLMEGKKPSEIRGIIKEYTGIDLTEAEEKDLIAASGVTESDYMKVGSTYNIQSAISKLMASRTHIGFASSKHTGEDVFLAVYNPRGQRPEGYRTNMQINDYLRRVMGMGKPLDDFTPTYFVPQDKLFAGMDCTMGEDAFGEASLAVTLHGGTKATFSANSSLVQCDGRTVDLKRPAVYIPKNKKFYLPADIVKQLGK